MDLKCSQDLINPVIKCNERTSWLVVGLTRMGKTYAISLLSQDWIADEIGVHLIDLGNKWSVKDRKRLEDAGASTHKIAEESTTIYFASEKDFLESAKYILPSLGLKSKEKIKVLKAAMKSAIAGCTSASFAEVLQCLKSMRYGDIDQETKNAVDNVLEYLTEDSEAASNFIFSIDAEKALSVADSSAIWDFEGIDSTFTKVAASIIVHSLMCARRETWKKGIDKKTLIIIDEFQNLEVVRGSILGTCLTEGAKYGVSLILATQFLKSCFPDVVIQQLQQCGFQLYFRVSEEDAKMISRNPYISGRNREKCFRHLTSFGQGQALFIGPHTINQGQRIFETPRIVRIFE